MDLDSYDETNCPDCGTELRMEIIKKANSKMSGIAKKRNQRLTRLICDGCCHTQAGLKTSEKQEVHEEIGAMEQQKKSDVWNRHLKNLVNNGNEVNLM